jgi:hypothetical protein
MPVVDLDTDSVQPACPQVQQAPPGLDSPCADALEFKRWWSGWQQERWSAYDPDFFLRGCEGNDVLIESVDNDDDADDAYIE